MAGVGLFFSALGIAFLLWLCTTQVVRNPVLNMLATAGLGETVAAGPERIECSSRGTRGSYGAMIDMCEVRVIDPAGRRERFEVAGPFGIASARVGRIARINGELAAKLPVSAILAQALIPLMALAFGGFFAAVFLRVPIRRFRVARLAPWVRTARIVDVDLLRRRTRGKHSWDWDYAFDHGGQRHYAVHRLRAPPALTDPVETRGAILLGSDSQSLLLNDRLEPLDISPDEIGRLAQSTLAHAAAWTPHRMPALDPLIASAPAGPERDFLQAWLDAWTDDAEAHRRSLDRRHAAARRLTRERVDELLQQARAAATP